jgi:hypothetical protein
MLSGQNDTKVPRERIAISAILRDGTAASVTAFGGPRGGLSIIDVGWHIDELPGPVEPGITD